MILEIVEGKLTIETEIVKVYIEQDVICNNNRLTTFVCREPRIILAEINTHRDFSRNSSSSRAIPVTKMISDVVSHPFVPQVWTKNKKGMWSDEILSASITAECREIWLELRDVIIVYANRLLKKGVHKQIVNRVLEPFMFTNTIITATTFKNYFALRNHPHAQPEHKELASAMQTLYESSVPRSVDPGTWVFPFIKPEEETLPLEVKKKVSTARSARLSYYTFEGGKLSETTDDERLYTLLLEGRDWSPFEHPAFALGDNARYGNFIGYKQHRKEFDYESGE